MAIYIETCIMSMLISWLMPKLKYKNKSLNIKLQIIVTILPLILLVGLRYGIGTDYFTYENVFNQGDSAREVNTLKAPLYFNVYNLVIQYLGGDYTASVFIIAIIYFLLIFYRVYEDSPYPWLSVFLIFGMLYIFISMNAMRQSLAMAILVFSLKYLKQKRNIAFFICVIIAAGIHPSCVMFIVVFFLYKSKINFKWIVILTPIIFACIYGAKSYLLVIATYLNYDRYFGGDEANGLLLGANFIWQTIIIIFSCYIYNKKLANKNKDKEKFKAYFATQLVTFFCYPLLLLINANEFSRILWIFGLSGIIFTPMLVEKIHSSSIRYFVLTSIVICFFINMYVSIAVHNFHEVLPYVSILDVL